MPCPLHVWTLCHLREWKLCRLHEWKLVHLVHLALQCSLVLPPVV